MIHIFDPLPLNSTKDITKWLRLKRFETKYSVISRYMSRKKCKELKKCKKSGPFDAKIGEIRQNFDPPPPAPTSPNGSD